MTNLSDIGFVKPEKLVFLINIFGIFFLFLYLASMFVWPFAVGGFQWEYVQDVWRDWQSLNVGVLAFLSSLIALNISRFNAYQKRQNEFFAAKAFLPNALSSLTTYCSECANLIKEAQGKLDLEGRQGAHKLKLPLPSLPEEFKVIFSKCIELADRDLGSYLAYILMRIQINQSRLAGLYESFNGDSSLVITRSNISSYMYDVGELQVLANSLFMFARNMEDFEEKRPTYDDFMAAYAILNIYPEQADGLEDLTRRKLVNYETRLRT